LRTAGPVPLVRRPSEAEALIIGWGDLQHVLIEYADYYNTHRLTTPL
jgi:hypothetical protein